MDKAYSKLITISFLITAFLFGWIVSVMMKILSNTFGTVARLTGDPVVLHGIPVVAAFALFIFFLTSTRTKVWAGDVVTEISKVVWPSVKDTKALTIVVCLIILISAIIFWIFDMISSKLVEFIIGLNF